MARVDGIEPSYAGLEAAVLPLNYTRMAPGVGIEPTAYRLTGDPPHHGQLPGMARADGLEPPTPGLEVPRSIR